VNHTRTQLFVLPCILAAMLASAQEEPQNAPLFETTADPTAETTDSAMVTDTSETSVTTLPDSSQVNGHDFPPAPAVNTAKKSAVPYGSSSTSTDTAALPSAETLINTADRVEPPPTITPPEDSATAALIGAESASSVQEGTSATVPSFSDTTLPGGDSPPLDSAAFSGDYYGGAAPAYQSLRRGSGTGAAGMAGREKNSETPDSVAATGFFAADSTVPSFTPSDSSNHAADSIETFSLKKMSPTRKIIAAAGTGIVVGGAVTFLLVKKYHDQKTGPRDLPDPPDPPDY